MSVAEEESRIRRIADSAVLVLTARLMSVFGPPLAIGVLVWTFNQIQDLNNIVTKMSEKLEGTVALRLDYNDRYSAELASRISRLEQKILYKDEHR